MRIGELERAVMDQLWDSDSPQTVRDVHSALRTHRKLAYTTVMTVLHRLSCKGLVFQIRDDRAYQYAPTHGRDELMAALMIDVLDQVTDRGIHNLAERPADDHANSQINHITLERKRPEFTDKRHRSLPAPRTPLPPSFPTAKSHGWLRPGREPGGGESGQPR